MTLEPRPIPVKPLEAVAMEWDAVAAARDAEIRSGTDLSYLHVLLPMIFDLLPAGPHEAVLDVGCGTGFLASKLAPHSKSVVGIDPSQVSIRIAQSHFASHRALTFLPCSVEEYARSNTGRRFPVIIANMALQAAPNLDACVAAMSSLAADRAVALVTLPHPWFWPTYWSYASAPWFSYTAEIAVEAPLRISRNKEGSGITTHIHRPLHRYVSSFFRHRFVTEIIHEPMPPKEVQKLYPQPWQFPRFLGMRLRSVRSTNS